MMDLGGGARWAGLRPWEGRFLVTSWVPQTGLLQKPMCGPLSCSASWLTIRSFHTHCTPAIGNSYQMTNQWGHSTLDLNLPNGGLNKPLFFVKVPALGIPL